MSFWNRGCRGKLAKPYFNCLFQLLEIANRPAK